MNVTYRVRSKYPTDERWIEEFWDIESLEQALEIKKKSEIIYPDFIFTIIKVEEI